MILLTAVVMLSCTPTSQVPNSIRDRGEDGVADTLTLEDEYTTDEEELERTEEQERASVEDREREEELEALRQQRIEELEQVYQERANESLSYFVMAQTAYFAGNYDEALNLVRSGIEVRECSDLYALKGAIHNSRGEPEEAERFWQRAIDMDEEVISDMYPGMEAWYQERNDR